MKNYLVFFVFLISFSACKKDEDVAPADPATAVSGTYTISRLQDDSGSYNLPQTVNGQTISAILTANRNTASTVGLSITVRITGQADDVSELGEVEVRQAGSGYELYESNTKIGTADGTSLSIDVTDGGSRFAIDARKQ